MRFPWSRTSGSTEPVDPEPGIASEDALSTAVIRVAEQHVQRVMDVHRRYPVDTADLLSDAVRRKKGFVGGVLRREGHLPEEMRRQIGDVQDELRRAIEEMARRMEDEAFRPVEQAICAVSLSVRQHEAASRLVLAHKQANISVRALQLTVAAFRALNGYIIQRLADAETDGDRARERDLLLANAILVYEVSDFVIRYVEGFELWVVPEIERIQREVKRKIADYERHDRKVRTEAQDPAIDAVTRDQTLEQVTRREHAVQRVQQEWEAFTQEIRGLKGIDAAVADRLPTLRLIRDNARSQIQLVDLLAITSLVTSALESLDAAVGDVQGLELAAITPERVERLLSVSV